jgi:hypothetical protein
LGVPLAELVLESEELEAELEAVPGNTCVDGMSGGEPDLGHW